MGKEISELYVKIGTNLSGLTSGLSKAFGAVNSFAKSVGAVALGNIISNGIGGAFRSLAGGIGSAIENGSSLNETLSKTDVLLGNTAERAKEFAKNLESKGLGGQAEILESYLGTVNQLTNQGMGKEMAQGLAAKLETRVGDVASQDNADPKAIRENLASAMAGEFQILRKYGVDASAEEQQASGKTRADYVIDKFLKKTQRAEGDFERTKYGFANLGRASDTKQTAVSARIGQDLQIVGQAFQYFRGRFLDTILKIAEGGMFKKLADSLYQTLSIFGMTIEANLPAIVTNLTNAATRVAEFGVRIAGYLANPTDTWKQITNRIAIAFLSIYETLTNVASKLSLGLIEKVDMSGAKEILRQDTADGAQRIKDSQEKAQKEIDRMRGLFDGTSTSTGPAANPAGALGMVAPAANAAKASSSAFNSLLSGVFGQKPDKQLAVLEKIAQNTSPKETGAPPVTTKTTLASPSQQQWGFA